MNESTVQAVEATLKREVEKLQAFGYQFFGARLERAYYRGDALEDAGPAAAKAHAKGPGLELTMSGKVRWLTEKVLVIGEGLHFTRIGDQHYVEIAHTHPKFDARTIIGRGVSPEAAVDALVWLVP